MGLLGNLVYKLLVGGHSYRYGTDWGERPVERTYRSAPTAGPNDDGAGWKYWSDPDGNWGYEREVFVGQVPENKQDEWTEHGNGVWHRKSGG